MSSTFSSGDDGRGTLHGRQGRQRLPSEASTLHGGRDLAGDGAGVREEQDIGDAIEGAEYPLKVQLIVYDLLPPSSISSVANFLGLGIYHTAVRIPAFGLEFAFGGHQTQGLTGIFALPVSRTRSKHTKHGSGTRAGKGNGDGGDGEDDDEDDDEELRDVKGIELLPGLRFFSKVDMGFAFGAEWKAMKIKGLVDIGERTARERFESSSSNTPFTPPSPFTDASAPLRSQKPTLPNDSSSHLLQPSSPSTVAPSPSFSQVPTTSPTLPTHAMADVVVEDPFRDPEPQLDFSHPSDTVDSPNVNEWGVLDRTRDSTPTPNSSAPKGKMRQRQNSKTLSASTSKKTRGKKGLANDDELSPKDRTIIRILDVIEGMKKEPEWTGTEYDLLNRNCNTFSAELIWRLCGKTIPGWINRAAWFGQTFPCLVPSDWIEPPEAPSESGNSSSSSTASKSAAPSSVPFPTASSSQPDVPKIPVVDLRNGSGNGAVGIL